jgi:hypothetical protein
VVQTKFYKFFKINSVFKGLSKSEVFSKIGFEVIDYILVVCEFKGISYLRARLLRVPHMLQSSF